MAIFSILLVLFISFQDASINTDSLTQMNNRRRAFEYLSSQINDLSPDRPMYLYICDINSFKDINDRYGHIEGDQALVILADAIKEVVTEINGFAARYGGDEFIIAIRNKDENYDPYALVKKIENLVDLKRRTQDKKYLISIAVGCVKCDSNKLTLENYIKEADNLLYIYKNDLKKREK